MKQHYQSIILAVSFALLASLTLNIFQPSVSHAYTLSGIRWVNNYSIPYNIYGMEQGKDATAANFGINAWNISPAPVYFVSGSAGSSGVQIYDENDGANNTPGWHYPITQTGSTCRNGFKKFAQADVVMNTYYTSQYPQGKVDEVATHELGHAIGLDHVNDQRQLMFYNVSNYDKYGINTPQSDDIAGTRAIYNNAC